MDIPPEVLAALQAVELQLLALPGVNGVGLGMREDGDELVDELAVRILVDNSSQVPDGVPSEIAGVETCIIERRYEPFVSGNPDERRYPDLHGGIRVTNPGIDQDGTMGAIVQDVSAIASGELLGLSCFHVVGDRGSPFPRTVWQAHNPPITVASPMPDPADNLGRVRRAKFPDALIPGQGQVRVGGLDAAVFALDEAQQRTTISRRIMGENEQDPNLADAITDTSHAQGTMAVTKRGATTRVTHGNVVAPYMSLPWTFLGPGRHILGSFEVRVDLLRTPDGIFALPGDSGSVVVKSGSTMAVGLLWGGTPGGAHAMMTDIKLIEAELEISMVWG